MRNDTRKTRACRMIVAVALALMLPMAGCGPVDDGDAEIADAPTEKAEDSGIVAFRGEEDGSTGWTTFATAEKAFDDAGYGMEFPEEVYGVPATDFRVMSVDGEKFLSFEYWDDGASGDSPLCVVSKRLGEIPSGSERTEKSYGEPHTAMLDDTEVSIAGGDDGTSASWKATDDEGTEYGYYLRIGKILSDERMLDWVREVG